MSKSLRVNLEVDIHAVTCPGVWFTRKGPVYLSVCFLGYHVRTKPFPPTFPLLFGDKFVFEKTFPGCSTLAQLQMTLEQQQLYIELLQENDEPPAHASRHPHPPPSPPLVLATFETSALEFLFPYPQIRPSYNSGVDVDLLMEPTREFPGIISPKIEASTRCLINETRHAHLDKLHDSAVTLNQPPPMQRHPHLKQQPRRGRSRSKSLEKRDPFVWRHVDERLIGRSPSGDREHVCDHGKRSSMRRSKSATWAAGFKPRRQDPSSDSGGYSSDQYRYHGRSRDHQRRPYSGSRVKHHDSHHHHHRRHRSPSPAVQVHRDYEDHHPMTPSAVPPSTVPLWPPEKPLPDRPSSPPPYHYYHPHHAGPSHQACHPHYDPYAYYIPPPPPQSVPPAPPPKGPPLHQSMCPDPATCPFSCHVPPNPASSQIPTHIHSRTHRPVSSQPWCNDHKQGRGGHYGQHHFNYNQSLPCLGPCCAPVPI